MKCHLSLLIGYFGIFVPSSLAELTAPQRVEFDGGGDGTSTDFQSETIFLSFGEALSGFTKFDPSLGTLTRVIVKAEVDANIYADLTTSDLIDPEDPFSLFYAESAFDYLQVSVSYQPSGENFALALTFDNENLGSMGDEFIDPFEWGAPDEFFYSDYVEFDFGGFAFGGDTTSDGGIDATDEDFRAADFIGTGNVTGLSIDFFGELSNGTDDEFTSSVDNVSSAFFDVGINLRPGAVTLQYEYTPADSTPAPEVTSYVKAGNQHTILFTGPAGQTGWALKGGTDLISFPNDHSSSATFSEPSPGNYQVTATLAGLPEEAYFLIVE